MSKYPRPNYYITQDQLIRLARVQILLTEENLDRFYAVDNGFTEDFLKQYQELIEHTTNIESDRVVRTQISQYTESVKEAMKTGKSFYHKLQYFVGQVYPESLAHKIQFGKNKFEKVKYSNTEFLQFVYHLNNVLLQNKNEMLAGGMPENLITDGAELYKKFEQAVSKQNSYKRERPVITEERIKNMNKIWEFMVLISRLAKIVYREEPARMNMFMLPKKRKPKRNKVTEEQAAE